MTKHVRSCRPSCRTTLLFCCLFLIAVTILGQTPTGIITGTVTDDTGAIIPNAAVTVANKATGVARSVTTNAEGFFSAPALPAGDYEVKAEVAGFRTLVRTATVSVGETTQVNMPMSLGQTQEVVTVEAAAAQMNYENNAVQGVINRASVQDLPLNGRSFMQLAVLEPGVTIANGSTAQFNALFTVNVLGGGVRTAFTVDGGNISDSIDSGGGFASMNFPQDVVQEFQLSSVSFDLGTPISLGGAVNIVTRSGSNDFHGSAYAYYRDHNMAAYPGLQRVSFAPNPYFDRKNPGGTLSGPLIRDKLFFFFNFEYTNQVQAVISQPNTLLAPGLPGVYDSPYAGKQLTARFDYRINPKHTLFLRYSHDGNAGFGEVFSPGANPSDWVHNIDWADQSIIGLTSTFTPTIVNDVRFQYMFWINDNLQSLASECVEPTCLGGGLPGILSVLGTNIGFGGAQIGANENAPQTRGTRRYEVNDNLNWQVGSHRIRFGFDVSRTRESEGQWGFCSPFCEGVWGPSYVGGKLGFPSAIHTTQDILNSPFLSLNSGIFTGIGVGPSNQPPPFDPGALLWESQYRAYAQDTWKIRPNLTVNFGLAWNAQTGYYTPFSQPQFLAPILGANNLGPTRNPLAEMEPAAGFAWSPGKSNKTVIRGGGGIYWDSVPGFYHNRTGAAIGPVGDGRATLTSQAFTNTIPGIINLLTGQPLPVGTPIPTLALTTMTLGQFMQIYNQEIGAVTAALAPPVPPSGAPYTVSGIDVAKSGIEIFAPNYQVARSYQANIGVQRDLGHNIIVTADYAMRLAVNLAQGELDYNLNSRYLGTPVAAPVIPACSGAQLFKPGIECSSGPITFWTSEGRSRYNGLLVKVNKRLSKGVQFTASYQLANERADVGPWDLTHYASAYGDVLPRHTLNFAGSWALPWGFQLATNMSFISRLPVNPVVNSLFLPGTVPASTSGAEPIPGQQYQCWGVSCGKSQLQAAVANFNTNIAGTKNAQGNAIPQVVLPSDYQLGDPTITQDFSLQKTFKYKERYSLTFYGQLFNAFNVSNLSGYQFQLDPLAAGCTLAANHYSLGSCLPNAANPAGIQNYVFGQPTARAAQTFGSAGPRAFQVGARFSF
jgi:Carboxypeptidase regulatory-like domain